MSDSRALRGVLLLVAALVMLVAMVAIAAGVVLAAVVWLCLRHPGAAAVAVLTIAAVWMGGLPAATALWVLIVTGLLYMRAQRREAFDRYVLGHWRRAILYTWRWRRVMRACDLARPGRLGRHQAPRLGSVSSSRWADMLSVHPLQGQGVAAFAARAGILARSFGALSCHVDVDATGVVRLEVRRGDPLRGPVAVPPVAIRPDPAALPLGRREDGVPWTVSLHDGHILVVGRPGSTRSVVWALLRGLAAPVREGTVEVWAVDGSGGIGLAAGAPMFAGVAVDPDRASALLQRLTASPTGPAGTAHPAGHGCRGPTGPARPSMSLLLLHDLGRWAPTIERRTHERLVAALDLALDYGTALGLVVVATAPEGPGEVASRFPQRIVLGSPAGVERPDPPEVGTASIGGIAGRVRVHRIDEQEMAAVAAAFPARSRVGDGPVRRHPRLANRRMTG
jgi:S-DNA-T family DNA segregation ATPase FtsK/SpoIIIE